MSSEHPFDSKLKQQFEQFQPEVEGDWRAMEQRLNAGKASGNGIDVPSLNRWAVATAVAAGSALMWVAKPAVDAWVNNEVAESSTEDMTLEHVKAPAISFDDAWEAYATAQTEDDSPQDTETEVKVDAEEETLVRVLATESDVVPEISDDVPSGELSVASPEPNNAEHGELELERPMTLEEILETLPFEASANRACEGVEVAFALSGVEREMNFLWNFGDGHFSSDPTPIHTFDEPGTYDVTLSVRPPGEGSINTRTIQNMITVLPKPTADFAWAFPATSDGQTVQVQLKETTHDAVSSMWSLDGQGTQVGVMELGVPGVYEVSFEATNEYGCFDEMKKDIHVGDMNGLLALSRFSPNEDGRYDTFMPHGLKELTEAWEMVISDLNGTEVYRTSELNKPWNGTLPSGEPALARSEFIWTVRCVDADGDTRLFTDKVLLER